MCRDLLCRFFLYAIVGITAGSADAQTLSISSPSPSTTYYDTSTVYITVDISGTGVTQVGAEVLDSHGAVIQQGALNVSGQTATGELDPPGGKWPLGTFTLKVFSPQSASAPSEPIIFKSAGP